MRVGDKDAGAPAATTDASRISWSLSVVASSCWIATRYLQAPGDDGRGDLPSTGHTAMAKAVAIGLVLALLVSGQDFVPSLH